MTNDCPLLPNEHQRAGNCSPARHRSTPSGSLGIELTGYARLPSTRLDCIARRCTPRADRARCRWTEWRSSWRSEKPSDTPRCRNEDRCQMRRCRRRRCCRLRPQLGIPWRDSSNSWQRRRRLPSPLLRRMSCPRCSSHLPDRTRRRSLHPRGRPFRRRTDECSHPRRSSCRCNPMRAGRPTGRVQIDGIETWPPVSCST